MTGCGRVSGTSLPNAVYIAVGDVPLFRKTDMFQSRSFIAMVTCCALVAGSAGALADTGNGKRRGQGNGQGF